MTLQTQTTEGAEVVRTVKLLDPLCKRQGKTQVEDVPATHVWIPNLKDLQKVAEGITEFAGLIRPATERRPFPQAEPVCGEHGLMLRKAGIRTYQLSRIQERRQERAQATIAELLRGKKVDEAAVREAVAETEVASPEPSADTSEPASDETEQTARSRRPRRKK